MVGEGVWSPSRREQKTCPGVGVGVPEPIGPLGEAHFNQDELRTTPGSERDSGGRDQNEGPLKCASVVAAILSASVEF